MKSSRNSNAKFNWLYDQVTYQEMLKKRFFGPSEVISRVALLLSSQKLRKGLKAPSMAPRLLIVGSTSAGKTHLSNLIVEMLKVPSCRMNLGNLVPEAYKGLSFSDGLLPLIESYNDRKAAEKSSCLIFDEVDKIIRRDGKDGFYQGIQHNLLGVLNGEVIQLQDQTSYGSRTINFNTHNCFTILCGVFPELNKSTWTTIDKARDGLVRYGYSSEFASRLTHVLYLSPLTEKQIREFIFNQSREIAELYRTGDSIPFLIPREVNLLVNKIRKSPYGIRSTRGYLHEVLERKVIEAGFKML